MVLLDEFVKFLHFLENHTVKSIQAVRKRQTSLLCMSVNKKSLLSLGTFSIGPSRSTLRFN